MNKELTIKSVKDDLAKFRYDKCTSFSKKDMISLLKLSSKFNREYITITIYDLVLIVKELERFGCKDGFKYVENFIRKNWE